MSCAAAVEIRHPPARLFDQQVAGGLVPRLQRHFPESVETSRRDIRAIQRRAAEAADGLRFLEKADEALVTEVRILADVVRKAGDQHGFLDARSIGHPDLIIVEKRPASALGVEHFIAHRIVDHARDQFSIPLERDRDAEDREGVRVVRCAVQRIDDPSVRGGRIVRAAFLAENAVIGKGREQDVDDAPLGITVGLGDEIELLLVLHLDLAQVAEMVQQHGPRFAGGMYGGGEVAGLVHRYQPQRYGNAGCGERGEGEKREGEKREGKRERG
jgi:hypothetical protein